MELELRKLQATDLFLMTKIIKGIGFAKIKDSIDSEAIAEARKSATNDNMDEIAAKIGGEIMMSILAVVVENLSNAEQDIYKLLAGVSNKKVAEIAKMDICDFMDLITAVVKKDEFIDFFKRASKLIR